MPSIPKKTPHLGLSPWCSACEDLILEGENTLLRKREKEPTPLFFIYIDAKDGSSSWIRQTNFISHTYAAFPFPTGRLPCYRSRRLPALSKSVLPDLHLVARVRCCSSPLLHYLYSGMRPTFAPGSQSFAYYRLLP